MRKAKPNVQQEVTEENGKYNRLTYKWSKSCVEQRKVVVLEKLDV